MKNNWTLADDHEPEAEWHCTQSSSFPEGKKRKKEIPYIIPKNDNTSGIPNWFLGEEFSPKDLLF